MTISQINITIRFHQNHFWATVVALYRGHTMDKIIELPQNFGVLQQAWHKLDNQLQILNSSATVKLEMQLIENKINQIQTALVNLDTQGTQMTRMPKCADDHQWMDLDYHKTFEILANRIKSHLID
jgi:plasmid maintenance system antidote protein VapI